MKTPDRKQHHDEKLSQDPFEEFAPQVRKILRRYRVKRKLSSIARQLGFHPARLTEMITKNGNGEYKRKITPHYLAKFIDSGIMDAREILGKGKLEELSEAPRGFFERMLASRSTLQLVLEAQRRGINFDRILEEILYPKSEG
jgi:hypothetical protein